LNHAATERPRGKEALFNISNIPERVANQSTAHNRTNSSLAENLVFMRKIDGVPRQTDAKGKLNGLWYTALFIV